MVAPKRGRDENADSSQPEELDEGSVEESEAADGDGDAGEAEVGEGQPGSSETAVAETVERGKLLVENLPSSLLFEYQDKLKELFSQYGEVISIKRGPIIVTELTTTPTLSAIVEFKNKESLEKAVSEDGAELAGGRISVTVQPSTVDTTVLVGVPLEACSEYVRVLFAECGEVAQIQEFSKTKYKILRVTYLHKESLEKALRLDRELRINGFLVTVTKYREDDEQRAFNTTHKTANKRQHQPAQNRNSAPAAQSAPPAARNSYRGRGAFAGAPAPFRGRGARGGFGGARGSTFVRGGGGFRGRGGVNHFMGRGGYMGRGMPRHM